MDLSHYVTQLREDLASAAAAGDEQTRTTAALLGAAIEPAARLAIMNALSDFAAEVTEALGDRTVEVRLDGREVKVGVTGGPSAPEAETPPQFTPPGAEGGDISRITLRLVEQIKAQAEQAAAQQGVSLNSWVSQAVQGALHGQRGRWEGGRWEGRPGWPGEPPRGRRGKRDDGDEGRLRGWVQG